MPLFKLTQLWRVVITILMMMTLTQWRSLEAPEASEADQEKDKVINNDADRFKTKLYLLYVSPTDQKLVNILLP